MGLLTLPLLAVKAQDDGSHNDLMIVDVSIDSVTVSSSFTDSVVTKVHLYEWITEGNPPVFHEYELMIPANGVASATITATNSRYALEAVVDPDGLVEETDETNNSKYVCLGCETPTPEPMETSTPEPTATDIPEVTPTSQDVCQNPPAIQYVVQDNNVHFSFGCLVLWHLYYDGVFHSYGNDQVLVVSLGDFETSIEVVSAPDSGAKKLYLTKESLVATPVPSPTETIQPEETATPVPSPTETTQPEETATPVPSPTETIQPEETATPVPSPTETIQPDPSEVKVVNERIQASISGDSGVVVHVYSWEGNDSEFHHFITDGNNVVFPFTGLTLMEIWVDPDDNHGLKAYYRFVITDGVVIGPLHLPLIFN